MTAPTPARSRRSLAIATLVAGLIGLVPPAAAAPAPEPAPDPAPQIRPDPADAGGGAAPAPQQETPAVQHETPAVQQQAPAPAQSAPVRHETLPVRTSSGQTSATTSDATGRSAAARGRRASQAKEQARSARRTRPVVGAFRAAMPSGLLFRREPAASSPAGDPTGPALVLASLGLLLLVGASASFLHATMRASGAGPWTRSA